MERIMRCYENADNKESGVHSPCLLEKGHKDKCEHFDICTSSTCMCRGFDDKLKKLSLLDEWSTSITNLRRHQENLYRIEKIVQSYVDEMKELK